MSFLKWDLRADLATVDWYFMWLPPRAGLLNVVSDLSMNGWGAAYPGPGCMKGTSSWSLDTAITLTQSHMSDSASKRIAEGSYSSSDNPSYGGIILTSTRLDGIEALTYTSQFPVIDNSPLIITITAPLYVLVAHGEADWS